jgi:hypothetical protein
MRASTAGVARLTLVSFVGVLGLPSCGGGGGPTRPSVVSPSPVPSGLAAGTALSIASGENGQPVRVARVTVAGRPYEPDASGQVTLTESAAWGSLVDVVSPGYLDRNTLVRRQGGTRLVLWPVLPQMGFDADYSAQLVYTAGTSDPPPQGSTPLRRMRAGTTQAFVLVTTEMWANEAIRAAHESAAASISAAVSGRIVYGVGTTRPTSGVVFEAKVDPGDPFCGERTLAFTQVNIAGNDIVGGRVVYCDWGAAQSVTVTHEFGHTFGLQHSPQWRELMAGLRQRGKSDDFGPREMLAMALMLERSSGNRFPDNDRDIPASSRGVLTIVCSELGASPGQE